MLSLTPSSHYHPAGPSLQDNVSVANAGVVHYDYATQPRYTDGYSHKHAWQYKLLKGSLARLERRNAVLLNGIKNGDHVISYYFTRECECNDGRTVLLIY